MADWKNASDLCNGRSDLVGGPCVSGHIRSEVSDRSRPSLWSDEGGHPHNPLAKIKAFARQKRAELTSCDLSDH